MRDRGALYAGIMLILLGGLFLLAQLGGALLAPLGLGFGWGQMWPFFILYVGLAFWAPILVWWKDRARIAGLAVPGTIITTNGLILLYQNLSGDWASWSYLWALEPLAVGAGLLMLYLLGSREEGVLVGAGVVGGIGLVFFVIFASVFGGLMRLLGPAAVILIGIVMIVRGLRQREAGNMPRG